LARYHLARYRLNDWQARLLEGIHRTHDGYIHQQNEKVSMLKYCVPYRNRAHSGGQSIAGHESDVVGSNSYDIM